MAVLEKYKRKMSEILAYNIKKVYKYIKHIQTVYFLFKVELVS